jgi:hypothetical protein
MTDSRRGSQTDQRARRLVPLSGRQGARPVDTIAGARKVAEEEETA